jgi:hypothetical protein
MTYGTVNAAGTKGGSIPGWSRRQMFFKKENNKY